MLLFNVIIKRYALSLGFALSAFCFISYFATTPIYATSGSFVISSPLQSGSVFGFVADTFSPSNTHTTVLCNLELSGSSVATNSSCDPTSPMFTYSASSGTYSIIESSGADTWTSNDLAYVAPTPTPTPSATPTPSITPVYVDIASTSAIAVGLHDMTVINIMFFVIVLFFLAVMFARWFFSKSNV